MAKELKDFVDLKSLEEELRICVEKERISELQNRAKISAVTDRKVASYEEFRDRVNAAHLRPLDKKEKISDDGFRRVWNPIRTSKSVMQDEASERIERNRSPSATPYERYQYLKTCSADELMNSRKEIPVGVLGDVIEALSAFPNTTDDILFVVNVLDSITKTERFRLGLDFLTCSEKNILWSLMEKITKSFNNRHQDLAEQGVTEWTVQGLREKYCVPIKRPQE